MDKGANSPNLFFDPKSAESALPPFSSGARDDLGQRRALEAVLAHVDDPANNPVSPVYGGPMIEAASAWCWDARPFPDFPARESVWADAPNWSRGHWLNGRCGQAPVADLLAVLLARGGVDPAGCDLSGAEGLVTGFVVDRPMALADAIRPLIHAFAFDLAERGGRLAVVARDRPASLSLETADLALGGEGGAVKASRALEPLPDLVRVRFIDGEADYQPGQALARAATPATGGVADLELPVVMGGGEAEAVGARLLARAAAERDHAVVQVGPAAALALEPGDCLTLSADGRRWRLLRADADERPRLTLSLAEPPAPANIAEARWRAPDPHRPPGPPVFHLLDLPLLADETEAGGPWVAAAAEPWRGVDVFTGPSGAALTLRTSIREPAIIGGTLSALPPGPLFRLDRATRLAVQVEGGTLTSCTPAELLNGANAMAVLTAAGAWEVLQFERAELIAPSRYRLSGLLRGQAGSEPAMALTPSDAPVVLLGSDLPRARLSPAERGLTLAWRAGPAGAPPAGLAVAEQSFAWIGLAYCPLAPAHLRARRQASGDLAVSWIRRTRLHGDVWDGEVPLGEEREAYRVEALSGGGIVRAWEVAEPQALYSAVQRSTDAADTLRVRQLSTLYGWGAAATLALA